MQYKLLTVFALAAASFAQSPEQSSESALISVASVLETAIPTSLIQEYLTNSAAFSSELSSEFANGNYPSWFTALPTSVQTFLIPATSALETGSSVVSAAPTNSANSTNGTLSRTSRTPTATLTSGGSSQSSAGIGGGGAGGAGASSSSAGSGSSSSTGGASMPTAIFGVGLAGAVGLVGVLAL